MQNVPYVKGGDNFDFAYPTMSLGTNFNSFRITVIQPLYIQLTTCDVSMLCSKGLSPYDNIFSPATKCHWPHATQQCEEETASLPYPQSLLPLDKHSIQY